ncbi:hypothetical protein [Candidatus Uabimicrobium sp. HlEnr_7]|uniref:hypothetical protein n=1 Tax=Candidatus Uabimicrobium helgolandensis TaxID=3095367 RepID=UPI0035573559
MINKEISHTAANIIVFFAKHYNCSKIYYENLKSLKSSSYSRSKNRQINTTLWKIHFVLITTIPQQHQSLHDMHYRQNS